LLLLTLILSLAVLGSSLLAYSQHRTVWRMSRERERDRNAWAARESELLDRLMHATGVTWTPPPRPEIGEDKGDEEFVTRITEGWKEV
jgi:hypothetical protein